MSTIPTVPRKIYPYEPEGKSLSCGEQATGSATAHPVNSQPGRGEGILWP